MNQIYAVKSYLLVFLLTFSCLGISQTETNVVFSDKTERTPITYELGVYTDSSNLFSLKDVLRKEFNKNEQAIPNLGTTQSTIWFKTKITNQTDADNLLLEIESPELDEVTFYKVSNDKIIDSFFSKIFV